MVRIGEDLKEPSQGTNRFEHTLRHSEQQQQKKNKTPGASISM